MKFVPNAGPDVKQASAIPVDFALHNNEIA